MLISEYPQLFFSYFLNPNNSDLFFSYYGKNATPFHFGRGALFFSIKLLNISNTGNILVPSYHCGVDIEAVKLAGADIRYYNVKKDATIDIDDLLAKIDINTKAVLITHYYGFPQAVDDILKLCRKYNLYLIEDCAHALFSKCNEMLLGSFGDISIFSQRKSLPLPDGGALLINNMDLEFPHQLKSPNSLITLKKTAGMLYSSRKVNLNSIGFQNLFGSVKALVNRGIKKYSGNRYSTGMEVSIEMCDLAMSRLSEYIMNHQLITKVIQRRRDNFRYLLEHFPVSSFFNVLYNDLPSGVCPLFFPVWIEGISRAQVQSELLLHGVSTFVFGENLHDSLPRDEFPQSIELSNKILCFPVHQDLSKKDLDLVLTITKTIGDSQINV